MENRKTWTAHLHLATIAGDTLSAREPAERQFLTRLNADSRLIDPGQGPRLRNFSNCPGPGWSWEGSSLRAEGFACPRKRRLPIFPPLPVDFQRDAEQQVSFIIVLTPASILY